MTTKTQTRAPARALVGAAAFGSLVGLAMGCAYLGGAVAKSAAVRAQAERLAGAAESGYAAPAVIDAAVGLDESAVAIAARHDPYVVAGGAHRDRQAAQFAARLERSRRADSIRAGLRKASLAANPAARPFRLVGALDDSRDLECLTQAVYYEARGEGAAGMRAVAQVVLNRVRHPAFPKTVCGVVFQGAAQKTGCQFSFACDGSMRSGVQRAVWARAEKVAARALAGQVMGEVGTATHFHTTAVSPRWAPNLLRVAQVGSHVFYRFGGKAGATGAFRYQAKPSTEEFKPVYAGFPVPTPGVDAAGETPSYKILFAGLPGGETGASPAERAATMAALPAAPEQGPSPAAAAPAAAKPEPAVQ